MKRNRQPSLMMVILKVTQRRRDILKLYRDIEDMVEKREQYEIIMKKVKK